MKTPQLLDPRVALVGLLLVAATCSSWWLGADHVLPSARTSSAAILAVAFVKVRLIGMYFMDLRAAPTALRHVFDAWCLTVCALVISLYLYA
ncbi:hypothetical protein DSM112329_00479 [Paraconexibacter sp. AEG42_29]|uniref:Prokaryotic cytochrome C oxidase subunit IV family protein n=1 Tax=Paraconexibacter sp. AEG42_29 TaxID=2997339 RepID=A0AAU7APQ8_9ACTN